MRPVEDGDAANSQTDPPSPPASARVQLEVDILANGLTTPHSMAEPLADLSARPSGRTVLVVGAEPDVRRYIRECLRERSDVRVLEAASAADGETIATRDTPDLMIVDGRQAS